MPVQACTGIALPLLLCTFSGIITVGFLSIELIGHSYQGIIYNVEDMVFSVLLK
jgi:hypothetical protein